MIVAIAAAFVVLLVLGFPIAFVLYGAGVAGLATGDGAVFLKTVPEQIFSSLNAFTFLAIPMFILAGSIMSEGGVARHLVALANLTVGRGRGGLGASVVASTMLFSGISGSSSADTAAIGRITLPSMVRQGYPLPFSAALIAAAAGTAALVPPSIDLIIIGMVSNLSIAALFAAGLVPAIINGLALMTYVLVHSRRKGYGQAVAQRPTIRETIGISGRAVPAVIMILLVLGGIVFGIFTPTEASAVAVFYGLFVGKFVYCELTMRKLVLILKDSIEVSGVVLLLIAMGSIMSYSLTIVQVPQHLADFVANATDNWVLFLLLVQILFFMIGMVMDTTPALLILVPLLMPIAKSMGIDPVHFGILVEANIAIGMITPPIGICLFTICAVGRVSIETLVRPLMPMIALLLVMLMVITYVEDFTLFLPRLLGLLG